MKNILLLLFCISFINSNAQLFQGKIDYKYTGINKNIIINKTKFIKDSRCKYKSQINNMESSTYSIIIGDKLFIINDNKRNILQDTSFSIIAESGLIKLKKEESILGYKCSVYKKKDGTASNKNVVYWIVAKSLSTNVKDPNIAINGKIILKTILKTEKGTYVNEAVEIIPMKLDDKLFELPDYPIKKVDMSKMAIPLLIQANHK
jgi:hypothetical protein